MSPLDPPAAPPTTSRSWAVPRARARRWLIDAVLVLIVCVPPLVDAADVDVSLGVVDIAAVVLAFVLIVARHRYPVESLAIVLVGVVATTAAIARPTALLGASMVLLFEVALRRDRRAAVWAGAAGIATILAAIAILHAREFVGPELLAGIAWPTLAVAAGDAVRSRREAIAAAEERAARAEATREEEARRQVAETRLHIARELHDVVAHHIAVINVQSGVAAHLLRTSPDDAANAIATVRSTAGQVLDELAGIVGVLRGSTDHGASMEPTPTLDDVPELVSSFERTGVRVELETGGRPYPVSDAVELAVYRAVQEALTNAQKHGAGPVRVRLVHGADGLELVVRNGVGATAAHSSGFGLVGMRERVHAAGGVLDAGPDGQGEFVVRARFPVGRAEVPS